MERRHLTIMCCIVISVVLAACHTFDKPEMKSAPASSVAEMQKLESRIFDYFAARRTNQTGIIYEMNTPEYRAKISEREFNDLPLESTFGLVSVHLLGIIFISDSEADVWLSELARPASIPTTILNPSVKQRWKKSDGEWYYDRQIYDPSTAPDTCGSSVRRSPVTTQSAPDSGSSVCGR